MSATAGMRWICTAGLLMVSLVLPASGAILPFVSNPGSNSANFATTVSGLGGSITTLDFETHPLGALLPNHYAGVTLSGTGNFAIVSNSAGPGQSNITATPTSTGEGLNPVSNLLNGGVGGAATLTVNFDSTVAGFGLFTIDLFNPANNGDTRNPVTLAVFDGLNGTGSLLGTVSSASFNFQRNFRYFMGIVSTDSNIRSAVFTSPFGAGDVLALDDLQIASVAGQPVPEPSSMLLVGLGVVALAFRRRLRRVA